MAYDTEDQALDLIRARPSVEVRLLLPQEHEVAGVILGAAFGDKYRPVLDGDEALTRAVAGILPAGGTIYLALVDGAAAGTATLRRRGDAGFGWAETQHMWELIRARLGLLKAVRAFFLMSLMEGGAPLDTYTGYVAAVGVLPQFRNMGVGSALLERIDRDARQMWLRRLSLHVVDTNTGARRLYERYGYQVQKTSVRHIGRSIWEFSGSHYMVKEL